MVRGTALAIKMITYVGVAPIVGAFANQLPRRAFLVVMDLVRAAVALLRLKVMKIEFGRLGSLSKKRSA